MSSLISVIICYNIERRIRFARYRIIITTPFCPRGHTRLLFRQERHEFKGHCVHLTPNLFLQDHFPEAMRLQISQFAFTCVPRHDNHLPLVRRSHGIHTAKKDHRLKKNNNTQFKTYDLLIGIPLL